MREYELVFIIAPTEDEEGVTALTDRVSDLITKNRGEVTRLDVWGRRRMAYAIKNHREGIYVLMHTKLDADAILEVERFLKLNESVIRHLLIRLEAA